MYVSFFYSIRGPMSSLEMLKCNSLPESSYFTHLVTRYSVKLMYFVILYDKPGLCNIVFVLFLTEEA